MAIIVAVDMVEAITVVAVAVAITVDVGEDATEVVADVTTMKDPTKNTKKDQAARSKKVKRGKKQKEEEEAVTDTEEEAGEATTTTIITDPTVDADVNLLIRTNQPVKRRRRAMTERRDQDVVEEVVEEAADVAMEDVPIVGNQGKVANSPARCLHGP